MKPPLSLLQIALGAAVALAMPAAPGSSDRIGYSGFGQIRVGMSLWELLVVIGEHATVESIEAGCTNVYSVSTPTPNVYAGDSASLVYMFVDDALARVEVRTPALATLSGVKVGGTEQDVHAAYPGRVEVSEHEYQEGHYLTVYSPDRKSAVVFDTDGARIRSFRIGRLPEALYIEGCS